MKIIAIPLVALLSACSMSPQKAAELSSYELCRCAMNSMCLAQNDARRYAAQRGEDCGTYASAIATEQANNMAAMSAGAAILNARQQQQLQQQQIMLQHQQMNQQQQPVQVEIIRRRSFQDSSPYR